MAQEDSTGGVLQLLLPTSYWGLLSQPDKQELTKSFSLHVSYFKLSEN